jgi:hypothetical protein
MAPITHDEDLETSEYRALATQPTDPSGDQPPTADSPRTATGASSIAVDFQLSSVLHHIERRQYDVALLELQAILVDQPDHPTAAALCRRVGAAQRQREELRRAVVTRGRSARR